MIRITDKVHVFKITTKKSFYDDKFYHYFFINSL